MRPAHSRVLTGTLLVTSMAGSLLLSHVAAPAAQAKIFQVIPADETETPVDFLTSNQALLAIGTTDILGGAICVVGGSTELDPGGGLSCDDGGAWGESTNVIGLGTFIVPIEGPPLWPGTWKLLADGGHFPGVDALSIPFTIAPCPGCSDEAAQAVIQAWKDLANASKPAMSDICNGLELVSTIGSLKAAGGVIKAGVESGFAFSAGFAAAGLDFAVAELDLPLTTEDWALMLGTHVACRTEAMYRDIAADPADPTYLSVAQPAFASLPLSIPGAAESVVDAYDRVQAFGDAQREAFERYQAALADNSNAGVHLQSDAMANFGVELIRAMRDAASASRSYADELAAEGDLNNPVLTSAQLDDILAVRARVTQDGFTADELQQLTTAGLSVADIEAVRATFADDVSDAPVGVSIEQVLDDAATSLDDARPAFGKFTREMAVVAAVTANPISASFTAVPAGGPAPLHVTFTDSSSPAGLSASWDFGDGGTAAGSTADHTYNNPGDYTATLTVTDGISSASSSQVISVLSPGANHPPVLGGDSLSTVENTPKSLNVLSNDFDPDFDPITVTGTTAATHGTAGCTASGTCTYTPAVGYTGGDSFSYTASDGKGGTATADVTVLVEPAVPGNEPPVAVDDSLTLTVNKTGNVFVTSNDSDPDFDQLTVVANTDPAHGTVSCLFGWYCNYTPAANYVGADTFDYTISDGRGGTDAGTVSITVEANHPPDAQDDDLTTRQNAPQERNVYVLANDTDADLDPLTVPANTDPPHGSVTCLSYGYCYYTPDADFIGSDAFDYTVSDGLGGTDTGTVHVTVTENHPPIADDDSATTVRDVRATIFVRANDGDPDFDSLSITGSTAAAHGMADCSSALECFYTPDSGFVGTDGFDYTLSDGTDSDVGHVTITVLPPCPPARCIDNGTILLAVHPQGHLNANDGTSSPAGPGNVGLDYLPTNNDATAPGCLCEGWGAADADSGVTGFANEAVDGVQNMTVESFVVTDSTAVSVVNIQNTLRVTHDYHPSAATPNLYEVTVTIENISGGPLADVRYRRVMDWDVEPTAFSEFVTIQGGNASQLLFDSDNGFETANPLGGRSDFGYTGDFVDAGPTDHGALFDFGFGALGAGKSTQFNIFYGAAGTETDAEEAINAVGAEVFSLGEPNTPDGPTLGTPNTFIFAFGNVGGTPIFSPDAKDDTLTTAQDTPGTADVLANDSDPNGDPLSVTSLAPTASHGTVACTAAGICTYTPAAGYAGPDAFDYSITDGNGGSDTATVHVTVTGGSTNHPPVGGGDSYSVAQDNVLTVPALTGVLANDTDADGDPLSVTKASDPAHGVVTLAADGSFVYTPAAAFVGPDSFTYDVTDGKATAGPVVVSIDVTRTNHRPTLASVAKQTIPEMVTFGLPIVGSDVDGDVLAYSVTSGPPGLTIGQATGALDWTPTESQGPGTYPVTVRVTDPGLLYAEQTFDIQVLEVNRNPSINAIADRTTHPTQAVSLTATGSDPDLPANTLSFGLVAGPLGATVSPLGVFSWTPVVADVGDHTVTIGVSDSAGGSAQTSFTIHVVRDATSLLLGGDSSGQYSDQATITATLKSGATPLVGQSVTIGLGAASVSATTNGLGVATAVFSIPGPSGSLALTANYAGTAFYQASSQSGTFTVSREDATVEYSGDTVAQAGATINLRATFTDSAASGYTGPNGEASNPRLGDITKGRIAFDVYSAGTCLSGSPIATLTGNVVDSGSPNDGIGTASATWSSSSEGGFCVVVRLIGASASQPNGYYVAPPSEPAGLAVYVNSLGHVTGGGWITLASGRANFGFNARATDKKPPKGQLVFVERTTYQGKQALLIVKSNAIDSLRTTGPAFPLTATLTGKASIKVISAVDGSTLFESGNATFTATVVDTNQAGGAGDSFAIVVTDKNRGVVVDIPGTGLGGGNIIGHIK